MSVGLRVWNRLQSGPPFPHWRSNPPLREIMALVNSEAVNCFIVGYACGTSENTDKDNNKVTRQYVRLLVSTVNEPSSFSRFSLFETDELLKQASLDKVNMTFPNLGERELRTALDTPVPMNGKRVLWTVKHCPLLMPGSTTPQYSINGVSTAEQAEADAEIALRNRYLKAEAFFPDTTMLVKHKNYILAEAVDRDAIYAALHDKSWQEELKDLLKPRED